MKIRSKCFLVCCFTAILSFPAFSQRLFIRFEQLSTTESFSQNMVTCILKDRYGFLWFGTDDGLGKYDGYKITSYRNAPNNPGSIGGNIIHDIFEDSKGRLWIGTDGGGLNLYDRNTNSFIRFLHNDTVPFSIRDNSVTKIREDKNGNLWLGTYYGLDLMTDPAGKFRHYQIQSSQEPPVRISALECDSQNNLWIGTHAGLAVMDPLSQKFRRYRHDKKNKNSISDDLVTSIIEDDKKSIWIATQNGLNLVKKDEDAFVHFLNDKNDSNTIAHNTMRSFARAENGRIWIGTEYGLDLFDPREGKFFHTRNIPGDESSLPHNSLRCTYVDSQGILWLGCVAGGVRKYDKKLSQFKLYKPLTSDPVSLNLKMAFSFAETKTGDIWIGTDGGGLNLFRKKDESFVHFDYKENGPVHSLLSRTVIALCKSKSSEDLWIGTYGGGLSCYHPATKTFTHYTYGNDSKHLSDRHVYALLEDRNGNIWVGTNDAGVNVLDKKTNRFRKFPYGFSEDGDHLTNACIRSFYEHTDGTIWIGTYGAGINIYNPVTKKFSYLNQSNTGLNNNIVLSICRDSKGNIWAGTMGGGLNLYDEKKNRFTHFTEEDGLGNNVINSIQEDTNGYLWLSTKKGITRFDPVSKEFKNYGLSDGLQGYEFLFGSGFKTSTGEIFFGGVNGFNVFDPAAIRENQDVAPVVITGFQLSNKPVPIGENSPLKKDISLTESITLPFGYSMLSFDFVALNFAAPEKNQYAYMLEGFDKDWIYCGTSRTATYTNLDPGTYTFRVKASNNDGVWNEKGTSIKIIITPPFWLTWWFKLLCGCTAIAGIYITYRVRMKALSQQKRQLEQQVQERTQSLARMTLEERKARQQASEANRELERKNKELEQFAYVASHDMQEPLRTISSFVELLQNQYSDRFDEKARKYMTFIVQASDRMKVLIKDLLEYSRIGRKKQSARVDVNKIVEEVLQDLHTAIGEAGAKIRVEALPVVEAYPTELKQVFQNLIINAIKFRKKNTAPVVNVKAVKKEDCWQFCVSDNGIGIDPNQTDRIFVIFQRLHTRNEYEGSGIGLSNCKKIAEMHKGRIWVESTPGEGSSFYFTIKENLPVEVPVKEIYKAN